MKRFLLSFVWMSIIGLLAAGSPATADNSIVIDIPGFGESSGRLLTSGGIMKQSLDVRNLASKTPTIDMYTGELVIARPLGEGNQINNEWFQWRFQLTESGSSAIKDVRVDIYGVPPGSGKNPILIRSFWLEDAWPWKYTVIQVDDPALPPSGGGKGTVFEESLTIKYRRVRPSAP